MTGLGALHDLHSPTFPLGSYIRVSVLRGEAASHIARPHDSNHEHAVSGIEGRAHGGAVRVIPHSMQLPCQLAFAVPA